MIKERKSILDELDKMESESKRCPMDYKLLMGDCQGERCAWWVDNKCATVSIAQSLRIISGKGVK